MVKPDKPDKPKKPKKPKKVKKFKGELMADGTAYYNTDTTLVPKDLGIVNVTIASNVGQGNGGTSLPCKRVYLQGALTNASYVMMNIGTAATSVVGIALPSGAGTNAINAVLSTVTIAPPFPLEVDDVSRLYFWSGTDGDIVNILYRR